jgi:hypothetical protein
MVLMTLKIKVNTQEFIPQMLDHMGEICKDHVKRLQDIKDPECGDSKVNSILSKGLWYPTEYCQALQKFKKITRFDWMVKNGASFHGFVPETFTPIKDSDLPMKKKVDEYKIAKDVIPSVALESIQNSFCLIGCGTARDVAVYRTLQDLLGKTKFDLLFASDSSTPLQLGTHDNNPYKRLFKKVQLLSTASLQPGDFCYFSNIQHYMAKHPFGPARGYNVIYKGNSQFLGLGLKPGCLTTDIEKALLDEFNAPQYSEEFFNSKIRSYVYGKALLQDEQRSKALVHSFANYRMTQKEFDELPNCSPHASMKANRRMLLLVDRPDLDKIKMLVESPIENIRKIFVSFRQGN